jgi:HK97 family phage prohead protease
MTMHRALGFVDRAGLTDDSPLRVVMASEGRKADKIDLRMAGADLARFKGNPVLGYGHSYWGRTNLPIGRVTPESLTIEGTQLSGALEFDQGDEFAREVERKMRAGFLNAVSIGFDVTQWESAEDSYWRGGVATKWELSELSVVPVPMDAAALVSSGRELSDDELAELVRRFEATIRQGRGPLWLPAGNEIEIHPHRDDPEPPAQGVDQDAARSLLAAFAPKEIG